MNYEPACAVCGRSVAPDSDHAKVEVVSVRMRDADEVENFAMHERCARNVVGSWEEP